MNHLLRTLLGAAQELARAPPAAEGLVGPPQGCVALQEPGPGGL